MELILLIVYFALGYWSTKYTVYYNRIVIELKPGALFVKRMALGTFFGFILIPIALFRYFVLKKR